MSEPASKMEDAQRPEEEIFFGGLRFIRNELHDAYKIFPVERFILPDILSKSRGDIERVLTTPPPARSDLESSLKSVRLFCEAIVQVLNTVKPQAKLKLEDLDVASIILFIRGLATFIEAKNPAEPIPTIYPRGSDEQDDQNLPEASGELIEAWDPSWEQLSCFRTKRELIDFLQKVQMDEFMPMVRRYVLSQGGLGLIRDIPFLDYLTAEIKRLNPAVQIDHSEQLIDVVVAMKADRMRADIKIEAEHQYAAFSGLMPEEIQSLPVGQKVTLFVPRIENYDGWFIDPEIEFIGRLKHMIFEQFYNVVSKFGWGEATDAPHLSLEGPYQITFRKGEAGFLELLAAVRVQKLSEPVSGGNVYRQPQLVHLKWDIDFIPEELERNIKLVASHSKHQPSFNLSTVPQDPKNILEVLDPIIKAIGEDHMVEKTRLTKGNIGKKEFLPILVEIADQIADRGTFAGIVITEKPYIDDFRKLEMLVGAPCVQTLAHCRIRPTDEHETYVSLFFYPTIALAKRVLGRK